MSNLWKMLCILLSLLYFGAAKPVLHAQHKQVKREQHTGIEQVLDAIGKLRSLNRTVECDFIPVLGNTTNSSLARVSCRALKSLDICNITNDNLRILKRSLKHFETREKNVKCVVPEDTRQEDIHSFLTSLYNYFRKQNYNFKPL